MAQETECGPSQPAPPKSLEKLQVALQRAEQAKSYATRHAIESATELRKLRKACTKEKERMQQTHETELKKLEDRLKDKYDDKMRVLVHENTILRERNETLQAGEDEKKAKLQELELEKQKSSKYAERDKATIRSLKEQNRLIQGERRGLDHSEKMSLRSTADDTMLALKDVPRHKKKRPDRVVKCTQCVVNNGKCDNDSTCRGCSARKVTCKRAMCKYFRKNTCANMSCKFAHEDDGFTKLVPYRRIRATKAKDKTKPGEFDELFKHISQMGRKKGNDGDTLCV